MVQLIAKDIKSIRMNRCLISYNNRNLRNDAGKGFAAMRLRSDDTATGMIAWRQNFPKVLSHNIIRFAVVKEWVVGQASFRADQPGYFRLQTARRIPNGVGTKIVAGFDVPGFRFQIADSRFQLTKY
jgi:hypothetical protein